MSEFEFLAGSFSINDIVDDGLDFWADFYDGITLKYVIGPVTILLVMLSILGLTTVINFIDHHNLKTIVHRVDRGVYVYVKVFIFTALSLDLLRIYTGPLPELVCWWSKFFRNFSMLGCVISLASVIVIRYLAIIRKINVLATNDQIFNRFWTRNLVMISAMLALLNNMAPGHMDINHYMCTGENPEKYKILGPKFPIAGVVPLIGFVIFVASHIKVYLIKKALKKSDLAAQPQGNLQGGEVALPQTKCVAKSVVHVSVFTIGVAAFTLDTIWWNVWAKNMTPDYIMQTITGQLSMMSHTFWLPISGTFLLFAIIIMRKDLREFASAAWRE